MAYEFLLRNERYEAPTLAEASAIFCRERDVNLARASNWPTVRIREIGARLPFARFSYNGRVWRDEPWTPEATPIYDNRI
jgi:hypothetical protein